MSAKTTMVQLECDALGKREFNIEQANRLLAMKPNGGWHLPENSDFQFSIENGIEYRRNTEENPRTGKKKGDK
jgi:hypothetical protein